MLTLTSLAFSSLVTYGATTEEIDRSSLPRAVITTDGEVDDMNSVLRSLLYANEMDIAGIVLTSSTYHYAGNGEDILPYRWTGTDWVWDYLDDYEEVYKYHRKGFKVHSTLALKTGKRSSRRSMTSSSSTSSWTRMIATPTISPRTSAPPIPWAAGFLTCRRTLPPGRTGA